MASGKLEVVDHITREVSRHTYFYIKEEERRIDGSVLSTRYHPSPISRARLEIPFMITFRSPRYFTDQKMKDFITKFYFYDHKPVTENVESDPNSDEFHIEIKGNVVEEGEAPKWWLLRKRKREKSQSHAIAMILTRRK